MKRTIRNPQKFIGKRIDSTKWNIPEGYNLCAFTGKFYAETDLQISFGHHYFDRSWLIEKGIYVEDAAWLSEEGYDKITSVLEKENLLSSYIERPCNPNNCRPLNRAA